MPEEKLTKDMTPAEYRKWKRERRKYYAAWGQLPPEEDSGCQGCGYDDGTVKHRALVIGTLTVLCDSCAKIAGEGEGL